MRSQLSDGSKASAVQDASEPGSETPLAWPITLPKLRRWVCSISSPHGTLVARFRIVAGVSLGGAERPFLMSL